MITIADINEAQGEKLARMIKEMGSDALFVRTDISNREDVERMVKKTVEHFGRLDCAFNNAGLEGKKAATAEISEDEWDRIMGINLKGAWFCIKYEIEYMLKHGGGAIVNTSSAAGLMGFPGLSAYTASKHGLLGLTKQQRWNTHQKYPNQCYLSWSDSHPYGRSFSGRKQRT